MERLILNQAEDVDRAILVVKSGTPIEVCVSDEDGPSGAEPQIEFLRILLDQTQRWFAVTDLNWMQHPFVPKKYLRSCVIRPEPPGRALAGVREPRRPSPDPFAADVALDLPR